MDATEQEFRATKRIQLLQQGRELEKSERARKYLESKYRDLSTNDQEASLEAKPEERDVNEQMLRYYHKINPKYDDSVSIDTKKPPISKPPEILNERKEETEPIKNPIKDLQINSTIKIPVGKWVCQKRDFKVKIESLPFLRDLAFEEKLSQMAKQSSGTPPTMPEDVDKEMIRLGHIVKTEAFKRFCAAYVQPNVDSDKTTKSR